MNPARDPSRLYACVLFNRVGTDPASSSVLSRDMSVPAFFRDFNKPVDCEYADRRIVHIHWPAYISLILGVLFYFVTYFVIQRCWTMTTATRRT